MSVTGQWRSLTGPLLMWHTQSLSNHLPICPPPKKWEWKALSISNDFSGCFSRQTWNKSLSVHLVCRFIKIWTKYLKKKPCINLKYSDRDEFLERCLKTSHSPRFKLCEHHMKTDMDLDRPYIKKRNIQTNNKKKNQKPQKGLIKISSTLMADTRPSPAALDTHGSQGSI